MAKLGRQRHIDEGKPTLVLDLDNTLLKFKRLRPGAVEFLKNMAKLYEVVVFSAGSKELVAKKVQTLDPQGCLIFKSFDYSDCKNFLDRDHICNWMLLKDLEDDFGRDLSRVVWLDDVGTLEVFRNTPFNGLDVEKFDGKNGNDTVLEGLQPLLAALAKLDDVRPALFQVRSVKECYVDKEGFLWFKNHHGQGWHLFGTRNTDVEQYQTYRKLHKTILKLSPACKLVANPLNDGIMYYYAV